jgi:hypothetical protein
MTHVIAVLRVAIPCFTTVLDILHAPLSIQVYSPLQFNSYLQPLPGVDAPCGRFAKHIPEAA